MNGNYAELIETINLPSSRTSHAKANRIVRQATRPTYALFKMHGHLDRRKRVNITSVTRKYVKRRCNYLIFSIEIRVKKKNTVI